MENRLPYIAYPACIQKILNKIKEAKTPDRFTYDFLETKLGFKGGNYKQFVSLAKKIGLLDTDGSPSELYKKFRNPSTSGPAMAQAIKVGYQQIFERNEYANSLTPQELKGIVVEITGLEPKSKVVQLICLTFDALKQAADFESKLQEEVGENKKSDTEELDKTDGKKQGALGLNLSYTINLVLPKTDDPAVFNAIFHSLRENLLRR